MRVSIALLWDPDLGVLGDGRASSPSAHCRPGQRRCWEGQGAAQQGPYKYNPSRGHLPVTWMNWLQGGAAGLGEGRRPEPCRVITPFQCSVGLSSKSCPGSLASELKVLTRPPPVGDTKRPGAQWLYLGGLPRRCRPLGSCPAQTFPQVSRTHAGRTALACAPRLPQMHPSSPRGRSHRPGAAGPRKQGLPEGSVGAGGPTAALTPSLRPGAEVRAG